MSIDDPTEDVVGTHVKPKYQTQNKQDPRSGSTSRTEEQHSHVDESRPTTCQPARSSTTLPIRRNINSKDDTTLPENLEKEETPTESSSTPVGPSARRLSVQDRINLFENKQKENTTGGSGGAKPVSGKPVELRRLSSDVSSAPSVVERAVLRRWSGVSDMSIDFSNEKKDVESPLCTPSSSSISDTKSNIFFSGTTEIQSEKNLRDLESKTRLEKRGNLVRPVGDDEPKQEAEEEHNQIEGGATKVPIDWKDQSTSQVQIRTFSGGASDPVGLNDRGVSQGSIKNLSSSDDKSKGFKGVLGSDTLGKSSVDRDEIDGVKNQVTPQFDAFAKKAGDDAADGRLGNKMDDSGPRDYSAHSLRLRGSRSHSRSFSNQFECGGIKLESSSTQSMEVDGAQLPQLRNSFKGEPEAVASKNLASSDTHNLKVNDFGAQKMKIQKPDSASRKQVETSQVGREGSGYLHERRLDMVGKNVTDSQESTPKISSIPGERVQRVRQTKGNQKLNDELNDLEKFFAEHKLRVPGEHSSSARRNNTADVQLEQAISSQHRTSSALDTAPAQMVDRSVVIESTGSSNKMENVYTTPAKMINNHDFSDDSRGKFYNKYMQKRDAKLREEWTSNRAEKEAKMKAMQDSLEKSKAEMTAKFSGFVDRQDSVASARRRAEKLRSFNYRSQTRDQVPFQFNSYLGS